MTHRLISRFDPSTLGAPPARFAVSFAGQGFDWRPALADAVAAGCGHVVTRHLTQAAELLAGVSTELAGLRPHGFDPLGLAESYARDEHTPIDTVAPAISVPGILTAQIATCASLERQGLNLSDAVAAVGHSQGRLGVEYLRDPDAAAEILALAQLIGAAMERGVRTHGLLNDATASPMLVIAGITRERLDAALSALDVADTQRPVIGLRNARETFVVVGRPQDLEALTRDLHTQAEVEKKEIGGVVRGGTAFDPEITPLAIRAGFHHPLLAEAVEQVVSWAKQCDLETTRARRLAEAVMTTPVDWPAELEAITRAEADWVFEIGPDTGVASLIRENLRGQGIGVLAVGTPEGQAQLFDTGMAPQRPRPYREFAPRLVEKNGERRIETAFTRLTGRSPMLLAGMTPSTVDPEIVAAAANAGHWAELAGGGQVTEEIFDRHIAKLAELLQPGRAAQFNAMFLDPYLWGMHFGTAKWVPKTRAAGAPLDGVVISAGVPDVDEAVELVTTLREQALPYVAFKPGAIKQIRQVLAIADALREAGSQTQIIIQVEGGVAGGHHSWESLDDLLLATYDEIRQRDNAVLVVGGGMSTPEIAADYLTGSWARAYGLIDMPVDGILIGTAAMATRESTASVAVKEALVAQSGTDAWVPAGGAAGGIASGRSQLDADIHEIDNSFARAGRLLDELASDDEAVAKRRDEVIAALNATCKPYFGELAEMTYRDWLLRFLELSGPDHRGWVDPTWRSRFEGMLARAEARLHPADHGAITATDFDLDSPRRAVDTLCELYPQAASAYLSVPDQQWFIRHCRVPGKPVNFVPVVDGSVRRWFRSDSLWQAHDEVYGRDADKVCIIPGPAAVSGITRVDEPVADLLERFCAASARRLEDAGAPVAEDTEDLCATLRACPLIEWAGRQQRNPVPELLTRGAHLESAGQDAAYLTVAVPESGGEITLRFTADPQAHGAIPQVSREDAEEAMTALTRLAAGGELAEIDGGVARSHTALSEADFAAYHSVTAGYLPPASPVTGVRTAPDVLVGKAWPAIFSAVAHAEIPGRPGQKVVEGMLNLVHLSHRIELTGEITPGKLDITAEATEVSDTPAGRVVEVIATIRGENAQARLQERFAIRGRTGHASLPAAEAGKGGVDKPISLRQRLELYAPETMQPFAVVTGDRNPIHVNDAAAQLAGLDGGVIVHGMWTSALAEIVAAAGSTRPEVRTAPREIVEFAAEMQAPILPGAKLEITVERTGVDTRPGRGEIRRVTVTADGAIALVGTATMAAERVFYGFPGQGIQSPGMGMDAYQASPAAREIWDRADAHTRNKLGFSILHIVRENPSEVLVDGERYTHPDGVLYLTQFTQVAMATLGCAQIAEMDEAGVLNRPAFFAGHSVGEYNALAAYAQVLSLEAVVEIVYRRGLTMHHLVERDERGVSNYGLAALRPYKMGMTEDEVAGFVARIGQASGEFVEIVNFNIRGRQYAVAGTRRGLNALGQAAEERAPGAKALVPIPGIDVPFHSSKLIGGVDEFRRHLDELIPEEIDLEVLEGAYLPNLVARPFELTEDFVRSIAKVVDSPVITEILADLDAQRREPARLGRTLLIELLAWQFTSPVRWIETQDRMLKQLDVDAFIEVGVGASPTLANMLGQTLNLPAYADTQIAVYNVERDRAVVFAEDEITVDADSTDAGSTDTEPPEPAAAQEAPAPAPVASAPVATERPDDREFTPADATAMLIALWTKLRPDQIGATDTIETLVEGVSSRRNQLLLDLGNEFGLGTIDGAADAAFEELKTTVTRMARGYHAFGPVLQTSVNDALRRLTGPAGKKPSYVAERVAEHWQLGEGWADHITAALVIGAREGSSLRGGELATLHPLSPTNAAELNGLIDDAVTTTAATFGVTVTPGSAASARGDVVDSAALNDYAETVTGDKGVLAEMARGILSQLGLNQPPTQDAGDSDAAEVVELVAKELGTDWVRKVAGRFDADKAVLFDDRWASAREDISRVALGELAADEVDVTGAGVEAAAQARYFGLDGLADQAEDTKALEFAEDIAVVTGGSPHSIAASVIARLLHEGASVIATTSRLDHERLEFYKDLYARSARGGASLRVVPANLSSFSDLDQLVEWIGSTQTETVGAQTVVVKPAMKPTLLFPFAAPRVMGTLDDAGAQAESEMRLLLWSVERLIAGLSRLGSDTHIGSRLHVVLPGSPNRGRFGGDGAYGEAKAALDALVERWNAEAAWAKRTSLVHALIGWVRGTGLMGGNDPLVAAVEEAGVRTFSTEEMAERLVGQAACSVREAAAQAPVVADFTGGLGQADIRLNELAAQAEEDEKAEIKAPRTLSALPNTRSALPVAEPEFSGVTQRLQDMVVAVGIGELGPYGTARTRFEAELTGTLSSAGVIELAWQMGLIHAEDGVLVDAEGTEIAEEDVYARYHDEVLARCGIREFDDEVGSVGQLAPELTTIYLDKELSFRVDNAEQARSYVDSDPERTTAREVDGEWTVTRAAGSPVRVPRRVAMSRFVGGQIPAGFDPAVYGIPADMLESLDRVAVWNLIVTVEAFLAAGFSPAELLAAVHPARVSSTMGTGMGGTGSLRALYVERLLAEPRANDILQEALPNVVAAHVMQSYVGGYGQMVHPVAACATAAVSVEEGMDKIRLGKADVVVAGGIDDLSLEGITGFGDMNATANSAALEAKGIEHRYFSRANDRRRAGFVESEGGGTVLLMRGSLAYELGMPVAGVIAFAESFADGAHTSIPAPGLGALSAARGGEDSRLARALGAHGVSPDEVRVLSKHDTSTNANDPNESDLHQRIATALGRSAGNPLYVISQKTLTGHAKGGAAAFQLSGLSQVLRTGVIPANRSLDCVDDALSADGFMVWPRRPLALHGELAPKAGLVTSLGFGHVSALIALVHPAAFAAAVAAEHGEAAARRWQERAQARKRAGLARLERAIFAGESLYERPVERNLGAGKVKEREAEVLLDDTARLIDGRLRPSR
ncbi:3-oxoacyl-ACP synthase [Corynebacterium yudongzhengii]|uniref:DUF1729 domain-containing protein n=1 Tax=Corynebacterium yudongzhengii TaxID=2080740 RepID=A0A2U1T939_9CORY|nr:type I polyketide synthase [Corynebacterium yudongzhengii]AWB82546.1 3-oxoacyl-ACP synthase [Corynebacterium yudongzhengii]PWC02398.1 DUF1729 domain-containing protein [Corynebacterium yudongzhengii]